jgi:spore coat polysaccharide biosynthesis protein SpsF
MTKNREKTVAFIVARLSSSRFPAKQLRTIGNQALLSWTLLNLRKSVEIDQIVLATAAEEANKPLVSFAKQNNIECYWFKGDPNQVTTRLCNAAEEYNAEICVLISGDCPLVDGKAIDQIIDQFRLHKEMDYAYLPADSSKKDCMLQGVSVARKNAWLKAEQLSDTPELKEHHFPALYLKNKYFKALACFISKPVYGVFHRLSVDTYADYKFFTEVYATLYKQSKTFALENVVTLLDETPEIKNNNKHVHQRKIIEIIPEILFLEFSPQTDERGNLNSTKNNIQIALHIIESKGWPVQFITNEFHLKNELVAKGIQSRDIKDLADFYAILSQYKSVVHLIIALEHTQLSNKQIAELLSLTSSLILIGGKHYITEHTPKLLVLDSLTELKRTDIESVAATIGDFISTQISEKGQ